MKNEKWLSALRTKMRRFFEPNFIIQFLLVVCTAGLIVVGALQKCTLDRSDATLQDTLEATNRTNRAMVYFQPTGYADKLRTVPQFQIGNAGSTPTKGLSYATDCRWSKDKIEDPFEQGIPGLKLRQVSQYTLGPKVKDGPISACLPPDKATQKLEYVYFYGWARYSDDLQTGKKAEHETQFCWQLRPIEGPCSHHNCVDEECKKHD
jgi:hypothetical protein